MKHAARRRQAPGHVMVKGGVPFPKATATGRGEIHRRIYRDMGYTEQEMVI